MKSYCYGCGCECIPMYCTKCAEKQKCSHGNKLGECAACDIEGDLAFDANRERGK